jgi:hypothetical protein
LQKFFAPASVALIGVSRQTGAGAYNKIYLNSDRHPGQKGVHLEALVDLMLNLSRLAVDYPEISELDLNPVIATPEGCWAVDWRLVV